MKYLTIVAVVMGCAGSVQAAGDTDTRERIKAVNTELRQTVRGIRSQAAAAELERRVAVAREARKEAERVLPGMAHVERQIEAAQRQLKALYRQRAALLRAHAAELENLDREVDEAEEAQSLAVRNNPRVGRLLAQRKALQSTLQEGSAEE